MRSTKRVQLSQVETCKKCSNNTRKLWDNTVKMPVKRSKNERRHEIAFSIPPVCNININQRTATSRPFCKYGSSQRLAFSQTDSMISSHLLSDHLAETLTHCLDIHVHLLWRPRAVLWTRCDVSGFKDSPRIQSTSLLSRLSSWLQPAAAWAGVWGCTANEQRDLLRFNAVNTWMDHTCIFMDVLGCRVFPQQVGRS